MVRSDLDRGFCWRAARGDWPREGGTKAYRHCGLAASMGPELPAISCQSADCELLSATGSGPLTVLGLEARRRSVIGDLSMLWNRGMASPSRDALGSRASAWLMQAHPALPWLPTQRPTRATDALGVRVVDVKNVRAIDAASVLLSLCRLLASRCRMSA